MGCSTTELQHATDLCLKPKWGQMKWLSSSFAVVTDKPNRGGCIATIIPVIVNQIQLSLIAMKQKY